MKPNTFNKGSHQKSFVVFSFPAFHILNWFSNKEKMRAPWKHFNDFLTTDWPGRDVPGLALSAAPGKHCGLHLSQCISVYSYTSWHTFSWCLSSVQCTPNWNQSERKILTPWESEFSCGFGKKRSLMIFQ